MLLHHALTQSLSPRAKNQGQNSTISEEGLDRRVQEAAEYKLRKSPGGIEVEHYNVTQKRAAPLRMIVLF